MPNEKPVVGQYMPMWRGSAGSGAERIYSVDGRWVKGGQSLSSGHKIVGEDKSGNLILSFQGVPVTIGMQGSHIKPYIEESRPIWAGQGAMTTEEENLYNASKNSDGSFNDSMGGVHSTFSESMKHYQLYYVKDRKGIDDYILKMRNKSPDYNYGTYSDYQKASPEKQRQGYKVYNNETGDFTDFFKLNPEAQ
jgi:hypothetical protein